MSRARRALGLLLNLLIVLSVSSVAFAQGEGPGDREAHRGLPIGLDDLKLDAPLRMEGFGADKLSHGLLEATGSNRVIIRLSADSVADARAKGRAAAPGQIKKTAERQQTSFLNRVLSADPSARILGRVQVVMNAVFIEVDAAALTELADDPAVVHIARVVDYQMNLAETVPYIGGSAVQGEGYDGTGIRVAVLDSGIDYYHAALGGSGNPADYAADDPTIIEPGTFPTAKVVGGYDFVGSNWESGADVEEPDPDPLDDGPGAGHGTHVAHIIGGVGGVAPRVDLYAVKVCSSISTACSGVALMEGMEFAVDPNGDGDPADHVDVVNMSLGAIYGNAFDDNLSLAVDNATGLGVLTVAAAGNGGDKPYVSDTPGDAPTAISVAQTNVPSAVQPLMQIVSPEGYDPVAAVFQPWSTPLTTTIENSLQYGDGAGGNLNGCAPFSSGSLAGKVVLVDRGDCTFTTKIFNIGNAGGLVGIIGLVAPGDPFAGGYADPGGAITIPGFMISQADSDLLKGLIPEGLVVRFDPDFGIPLVEHMVGSSSRGPALELNILKPEIGAPGASVSAIAGTGTGEGPFGGTSGATPMVAGSAALMIQAYPDRSPMEVKAVLMNTAETDIKNMPLFFGGDLAPISRIGGGEVRVNHAFAAPAAAWDDDMPSGGLSFGFLDVPKETVTLHKMVRVRNYSDHDIQYTIMPTFRFANDEMSGAVSMHAPRKVKVKAGRDATFPVKLTINGALLWNNHMNSGSQGANGAALTLNEFDGYLILDDGEQPIHLPWHVLPRKAAEVVGRSRLAFQDGMDVVALTNTGVGRAQNDAYSLLAVSPDMPEGGRGEEAPIPDIRGVGINTFPVPAGFCSAEPSFIWAFAINTWERQSHLLPVIHYVYLDVDRDGADDYAVLNSDVSGLGGVSDGRQLTWAWNLNTGGASAFFFAEHATNTGNAAFYICAEQVGLTGTDMLSTQVDMAVFASDFYYGGPGDFIGGLTVTPYGERYVGAPEDIPGKSEGTMTVYDFGPFPGNSPELGVMVLTNGDRGSGARGGATQDTEALLFRAP